MGLKEELEEKAESCDAPEEYIGVAKEIVEGLDDKDWAVELMEEGAEWAQTYDEAVVYAEAAKEFICDDDVVGNFLSNAKMLCMSAADFIGLGTAAGKLGLDDMAKEMNEAAMGKCTKLTDFLNLSNELAKTDPDMAKQVMDKAFEKCTQPEDFVSFAKSILDSTKDQDKAKEIYEKGIAAAKTADGFSALAAGAIKDLGDKDFARAIYEKAAGSLEKGDELLKFAEIVKKQLDDNEFTLSVYKKAEEKYAKFDEYLKLAKASFENTGDAAFASGVYQKAAATNPDCGQLVSLALAMANDLGDTAAALPVLKQAQAAVRNNADFLKTADAILDVAKDDKAWTDSIAFQKAKREEFGKMYDDFALRENEITNCAPMRILAGEVFEKTGDNFYAAKLYKKTENLTIHFSDSIKLAAAIHADLNDAEWIKAIYTALLDKCKSFGDYNTLTNAIQDTLGDSAWVKTIYEGLEKKAKGNGDLMKLAAVAIDKFNDKEWAQKLITKAAGNAKTVYDFTFAGSATLNLIGDKEGALALYKSAEGLCSRKQDYAGLVTLVKQQTADKSILSELLVLGRQKLTDFSDQIFLAEALLVDAADAENAAAVYEEAELNALSNDALSQLGTSVSGRLGDAKWASRILGKIR
jgi:tetratricopeptide (TPR) repeat protein